MKLHATIEKKGLRWYYYTRDPDKLYPSVSTVIGWYDKLFGRWKNYPVGNAANCGTGIHFQIQKYILDEFGIGEPDIEFPIIKIYGMLEEERRYKLNRSMQMWFEFLRENKSYEPLNQELALFYKKPRFAGRIDQYIKLDGKYTLLDIKTGGYWQSYDWQIAGYVILLSQLVPVDRYICLYLDSNIERNPSNKYRIHEYSKEEMIENSIQFMKLLDEYYNHEDNIIDYVFGNGDANE